MSPFDGEISVPTENLGLLLKKSFAAQLNKSSSLLIMDNKITLPSLEKMNIDYHYIISSLVSNFDGSFKSTSAVYLCLVGLKGKFLLPKKRLGTSFLMYSTLDIYQAMQFPRVGLLCNDLVLEIC